MTKAKWYFDFISPFAYLQFMQLPKLPTSLEITPVPAVFGAILKHWGQLGPAEIPPKRRFVYRFFQWNADQLGVPLRCHLYIPSIQFLRSDYVLQLGQV
tara:strand:- start:197 stop:493 length:297 start_codon:yes stop_codon:yes gene_type:complete